MFRALPLRQSESLPYYGKQVLKVLRPGEGPTVETLAFNSSTVATHLINPKFCERMIAPVKRHHQT